MTDWLLREGERLDDLVRDGMRIIQREDEFCFSIDSVLLAHYTVIRKQDIIADLGTGTGVIPLLLTSREAVNITAFEINPVMADIARRNVEGNHRGELIHVIEGDYRNAPLTFGSGAFSSLVVNPPYREAGSGRMSPIRGVASASYELDASLEDVFKVASKILKYGGRITMVHRADRLADLITYGRAYRMEVKRMRFVYARKGHTAVRILMEFRYGGHPEAQVDPPLLLHKSDGTYTDEVLCMFGKDRQ
ncbi:MAG: methyltransferase [Dialister sp.]|nr:methyltransferase [Dialister sp.]